MTLNIWNQEMRCANSELLGRYLDEMEEKEKELEIVELEFFDAITSLRDRAIELDCLELLKEVAAEELDITR